MRVAISGASGLIGSAVGAHLSGAGHDVVRLVRPGRAVAAGDVRWDPPSGEIDQAALAACDAVVHLAGENIAGRWTAKKRRRIRDSRVGPTAKLSESLAGLAQRPGVLLCASAAGYYGDSGQAPVDEDNGQGDGFLADVCRQWEAACAPACDAGLRVVNMRFSMVLARSGGALKRMLLPFRLGLGGRIGDGKQYWSWIALEDVVAAIEFLLTHDELAGPVNMTSPHPATNREFTKALARAVHRPAVLPMPAVAARLAFGQMADGLLLASTRAQPARLLASGFEFHFPQLYEAFCHILRTPL